MGSPRADTDRPQGRFTHLSGRENRWSSRLVLRTTCCPFSASTCVSSLASSVFSCSSAHDKPRARSKRGPSCCRASTAFEPPRASRTCSPSPPGSRCARNAERASTLFLPVRTNVTKKHPNSEGPREESSSLETFSVFRQQAPRGLAGGAGRGRPWGRGGAGALRGEGSRRNGGVRKEVWVRA